MKVPVVLCKPINFGEGARWRFWCPFCRKYHTHGAAPGHRVAHCHTEEGYAAWPEGYELRLDPTAPRGVR
jgi:hypothetical protein